MSSTKVVTQKRSAHNEKLDQELTNNSQTEIVEQKIAKFENEIKCSLDQPNQPMLQQESVISTQHTGQDTILQNVDSTVQGESSWDNTSSVPNTNNQDGSPQFKTKDPIIDAKRKLTERHPGIYGTTTDLSQNRRKSSDSIKREELVHDRQSNQPLVITGKKAIFDTILAVF